MQEQENLNEAKVFVNVDVFCVNFVKTVKIFEFK